MLEWYRKGADIIFEDVAGKNYGQLLKGNFNATTAGYGLQVNSNRTWIERGNADDGGKVVSGTGAAYLFASRRLLLTAVQTGNNSFFGGCDRLSIASNCSGVTGIKAAHWGFLEFKSGGHANVAGAVRGDIKLVSGSYAGGIVSCFLAACEDLSGTHSAHVTVIHVPTPQAGTFDTFLELGAISGAYAAKSSISTAHYGLPVSVNGGTIYYIPVCEMS